MIKRYLSIFLRTGGFLLLMLFLLPSSHVFASSSQIKPNSGFMKTCTSLSISGSGVWTGSCRKANGTVVGASLNLNPYIGNDDGDLVTGSSGFARSCINLSINYDSGYPFLVATCYDISGFAFVSSISLNDYISNINGSMVWAG